MRGISRRQHDQQVVRRDACAQRPRGLGGDRARLARGARDLEQPDAAVGQRRRIGPAGREQPALERDQRVALDVAARRKLDVLGGARGEPLERRGGRGEGVPARLERQRDGHLRARRDRLDERALGRTELLEPVHEQRRATPGCELARDPAARLGDPCRAVERAAFGRLARPGRDELRDGACARRSADRDELALERRGLDARLGELVDELSERGREAGRARRGAERLGGSAHGEPSQVERPDRRGERGRGTAGACQDALGEAVERRDEPAEEHAGALGQLTLEHHPLGLVRYDQDGVVPASCGCEELLYDQPELAAPGRPDDQPERHACELTPASAGAERPPPAPRRARRPWRCCRGRRS